MKLFLAVLLLSVQAFAAETQDLTRIEDEAMKKQYREATLNAVAGKSFTCRNLEGKDFDGGSGSNLNLSSFSEIVVNRGAQPVLIYSRINGGTSESYSISTTPDFKNVIGITYRKYQMKRVNTGTLVDPNFVNQSVLEAQNVCTLK